MTEPSEADVVRFVEAIWGLWVPEPVKIELVGKAWRSPTNAACSWSGPFRCWVVQARQGRGPKALLTSLLHEAGHLLSGSGPMKTSGDYTADVRAAMQEGIRPASASEYQGEVELQADSWASVQAGWLYSTLKDWQDPTKAAEVVKDVVEFNRRHEK